MATSEALHERFQRNTVFAVRFTIDDQTEIKDRIAAEVARAGARVSALKLIKLTGAGSLYEMTVFTTGDEQMAEVREALEAVEGVEAIEVVDLAMESHRGGTCEMRSRASINSNTDLRIVYTPGVARVCKAIEADPALARQYTNIANKVAIVTNGTAILGLGDIGPLAGLPVMEGKAAIFWEFAGVSAAELLVARDGIEVDDDTPVPTGSGDVLVRQLNAHPWCTFAFSGFSVLR